MVRVKHHPNPYRHRYRYLRLSHLATIALTVWGMFQVCLYFGWSFTEDRIGWWWVRKCLTEKACTSRLQSLRSKLELEEVLYQDQRKRAVRLASRKIAPSTFTRDDIVEARMEEILRNDVAPSKSNPMREEMHPDYQPSRHWKNGRSWPQINVVGMRKTGTSQLYNIFLSHPDVLTNVGQADDDWKLKDESLLGHTDDWKEHCAEDHYGSDNPTQDLYEYALYNWNDFYHRRQGQLEQRPDQQMVNGCLNTHDLERRWAYNPPTNDATFFLLLRDPADWAWAAYNFWCDAHSEIFRPEENWVNETLHYRSPELFHELLLAGDKHLGTLLLKQLKQESVLTLRRLRALIGKDNLVVLKNEDLQPQQVHKSGLVQTLSQATGLSPEGFDPEVLTSRSNCNSNKGYHSKCHDHKPGSGYPVTANRPMLEASRRLVYLQWHQECRIWAQEFGVVYPDCLEAVPGDWTTTAEPTAASDDE